MPAARGCAVMSETSPAAIPADSTIRLDPFLQVPLLSQADIFVVRDFPLVSVEHHVRTADDKSFWVLVFYTPEQVLEDTEW